MAENMRKSVTRQMRELAIKQNSMQLQGTADFGSFTDTMVSMMPATRESGMPPVEIPED